MSNKQTPQETQEVGTSGIPSLDEILLDAPENEATIHSEELQWVKQQEEEIPRTSQIVVERKCRDCGTVNQAGIFVCEDCGMILATKEVSMVDGQPVEPAAPEPVAPSSPPVIEPEPVPSAPGPMHTAQFSADTDDDLSQPRSLAGNNIADLLGGTFVFTTGMVLRLRMRGVADPIDFRPQPGKKLMVGRSDEGDPNKPDIDFAQHNALQYGISRTHASFEFRGKSVFLTDLGSTNGTFLNGIRFDQNESHELRAGDFIKFGKMVIAVEFVELTGTEPHVTGRKKTQVLSDHD